MTQSRFQRYLLILSLILMTISLYSLLWKTQRQPCCKRGSLTAADVLPQKYIDDLPVCSAIIKGDATDMVKDNLQLLMTSKNKKNLLTEAFYLNMTRDCKTYVKERGFLTVPLTEEERDFPIAYSIVIHEKIEMFERLLRAIYTPQNVYCVHVDLKSSEEYKNAVKGITSCFPNVFVASKLENVVYASWSRVQADLNCMKDLLNSTVQWRYLLNTCGADFPIKTNAEMVQALQVLNGKNSMESEVTNSNKKGRWQFQHRVNTTVIRTAVQKPPPPINSPMFSGNAYFVVTRDFVRNVMESKQVQHLLEWEKDTYSPDEHLWATLQRMPSVPGSNPADEKYHASDMQAIARVVKWSYLAGDVNKGAPYTPCTGTYRRAVCVYGFGDLQWLLQQHHLIANKFDPEVDDVAIRCLEAVLRHKAVHPKYSVTENTIHALRI